VRIRWRGTAGARGYVVRAAFNDGAVRRMVVGRRARAVAVRGVLRGRPVRVRVAGTGQLDRMGSWRSVRLR
jgi:hypothetical protein